MLKKIKNFICKLLGIKQCACPEDMQVEVFTQTKTNALWFAYKIYKILPSMYCNNNIRIKYAGKES
jgi:hypothetical protein